jgi:phosphoglycerol transferase MdoB-like AlkP superfamily enzyme
VALRIFYVAVRRYPAVSRRSGTLLLCSTGILFAYRGFQMAQTQLWTLAHSKQTCAQFLQTYAGYNASFKLIFDAIAPEPSDGNFYRFLTKNTNIPRSIPISPAEVKLVEHLSSETRSKPNIFIVVIDSLRRDYLSPYNSEVDFTPNIERFAGESVVMKNAFTHYGGTGLSEPSIWVGGMMVHKQYVTPFAPMNALQKLLETDGYRSFVTRDSILQTVVAPSPNLTELDQGIGGMNYDLCTSLDELEQRLTTQPANHPPLFAYTQPQNIHISVINREGAKSIDNANYRNLYAPYASRLRRMDGCFGKFVDTLKSRGLYENSVVILTADHGDSLGEQGRWGHAYTVYPEIMRVPLIVHLPAALISLYSNPRSVAFSTDITPSLYYLLGHKPTAIDPMYGRPLFTERAGEQAAYQRDDYLVASSYGAVYGILSGDGRSLFVSDAVNYKDYAFDLTSNDVGGSSVNSSTKAKYEKKIREGILAINRFYHYKGGE